MTRRTAAKTTLELRLGEIVVTHGMRVRLDRLNVEWNDPRTGLVRNYAGTILNLEAVRAEGYIPPGFIADGTWNVQGNGYATWYVEVPTSNHLEAGVR